MKTGIYVRVSTEEQVKEGFSIRAQEQKLRDYARLKEWPLHNVYVDEGISGKNITDRPAINRMLSDIEKGFVENVLVFKVDRLTRSTRDLIDLVEFFKQYNCTFNSFMEAIDTNSATGRMFLKIIGIFAEFERENLIERVKVGFERKVKEGFSLCTGIVSYGYDRPKGQKVQTVNLEEANIVRQIFNMFVRENYATTRIATILNAQNIPTKFGRLWNAKTIKLILTNPTYIGKVRYCCDDELRYFEADGKHEPIIDLPTFYEAQQKFKSYEKLEYKKHPQEDVYFSRIAVCDKCGSKLTPKMSQKTMATGEKKLYRGYRCIASVRGKCNFSCTHEAIDEAFFNYLENYSDLDVELEQDEPTENNTVDVDIEIERNHILASLNSLDDRAKEIAELYVSQHISFEEYKTMLQLVTEKKQTLEIRLNTLAITEKEEALTEKIIVRNIQKNWEHLDNKERMEFMQRFIKKIVVCTEKGNTKRKKVIIKEVEFNDIL